MTKIAVIAATLLSIATASAETNPPLQAPAQAASPPMVRNIGIAEMGDAIVVRDRKVEPPVTPGDCKQPCR